VNGQPIWRLDRLYPEDAISAGLELLFVPMLQGFYHNATSVRLDDLTIVSR
jgi:hypothetical protein